MALTLATSVYHKVHQAIVWIKSQERMNHDIHQISTDTFYISQNHKAPSLEELTEDRSECDPGHFGMKIAKNVIGIS